MMIGDQLQKAIYAALTAAPALVDGKVFDTVPPDTEAPYIHIGNEQVLDDSDDCAEGWEVFTDIHIWSEPETGSKLEVKSIGPAVVQRLTQITAIEGFRVVIASIENIRYLDDPDGVSKHGIVTSRHVLEPA
ncbi:DUF3168 domain-containing protein [Mesorhizobium sp. Pch-S]|uniref:DUF3168 domain-containing protein n=1 Tax=Mesorhizobium sp. Pch-S TaxID=2082387 RepID=UPI001011045D|nr:DUF3168 domain-containing protein [Mesorhizobium sp. Pch-S]QAZ46141.1 hypothetical protein C1M53_27655 [Mesorhizobium sp. Pch-S]